jgi:hypothetical protein
MVRFIQRAHGRSCVTEDVSQNTLCSTSGCVIGKDVVPNRMSYAGQIPDRISFCQTLCA